MARLTERNENKELLVREEERLLNANGIITKDEMYKIMRHLAEKLAQYEDKEEQGLLLQLPCKVGNTAWYIDNDDDNYPIEIRITHIEIKENYILYYAEEKEDCGTLAFDSDDFGKTIFFTQAEAEQKLKEMESD